MAPMKRSRVEKPHARKKQKSLFTKAIPLEKLDWKEVALPERLEDAEGFFGLEEIDDVEIHKDEATGAIQYRVDESNGTGNPSGADAQEEMTSEWEGLKDDIVHEPAQVAKSEVVQPTERKGRKKKKQKTGPTKVREGKSQQNEKNAFELLHDSDEGVDVAAWNKLGLPKAILSSLSKMKFAKPTPIQAATIPHIRRGQDVVGKASTGSGKTLAFGIPIVEHFLEAMDGQVVEVESAKERIRPPVALILSPTRELAHQLSSHLGDLCSKLTGSSPRIASITGGLSLHKQQRVLATADIIIGTPGRLWEIISSTAGLLHWLRQIKFLVVDEADRLLSEGHFKEVEEILNSLDREDVEEDAPSNNEPAQASPANSQRQTLVFSATFERDLQRKLAGKGKPQSTTTQAQSMEYLLQKLSFRFPPPKFIDVNPLSQMATNLREGLLECAAMEKDLYLYALCLHHPQTRTLIFTNSIAAVRRLASLLKDLDLPALAIHSAMEQKARLRSLERFSSTASKDDDESPKKGAILVATDVAARGLDIPNVELILHYHAPRAADAYVHRSGRTARGDASGSSILLCSPEEVVPVRRLIAKIHSKGKGKGSSAGLRTLDVDRRIVNRLNPRVSLAQKITEATMAKEKTSAEDNWLKNAAEELGVEYDGDDFLNVGGGKGRGKGREKKMKEAAGMSKRDVAKLRAELKVELSSRVNVGVSEKYLTSGGMDVGAMMGGQDGPFLGGVKGIGLEW
ncbi:MAG: ATP-dependent RNA helicase [Stictis urceolatum]|nr:ATP-dependent RNA helicase [Stictis urceolata]